MNIFKKSEDNNWGMVFLIKDKNAEIKFKNSAKKSGCTYYREQSKQIAYSITKIYGKKSEEKLKNFKKFLRELNSVCNYNQKYDKNNNMIIVKVESK